MCKVWAGQGSRNTMEERKRRLTRSLSAPRRCRCCQKMIYFTAVRCKQCGNVTHESCANHVSHWCNSGGLGLRRNSHQPPPVTGGGDVAVKWRRSSVDHPVSSSSQQYGEAILESSPIDQQPLQMVALGEEACVHHSSTGGGSSAMTGLLKVVHWLSQRRRSREMSKANAADKHVKGRFGLHQDKLDDKVARKRLKALLKNAQKRYSCPLGSAVVPSHCYCGWPHGGTLAGSCLVSPSGSLSSSGCISTASSAAQTPSDTEDCRVSSATFRTYDRIQFTEGRGKNGAPKYSGSRLSPSSYPTMTRLGSGPTEVRGRGQCLSIHGRFGRQWFSKAKTLSLEPKGSPSENLCATWPPAGKSTIEEFLDDTESGIGDCDLSEDTTRSQCADVKETLGEWCIPFGDLEFKERLRHGRQGDIFRGRWHGEVLIYTFRQYREREVRKFLDDVAQLSMIRHENIVLFMGACIDPPRLAIITSMRKGPSLYEHIHLKRHRLPFHTKVNIARQIAQGMGYLHAKGIVHKKLNSKNIILESRVKLCIMDQGMAAKEHDRADYGCIPRGHLCYISPELMRTLQVEPPRVYSHGNYTQESDVYAFGSVLYELLAERFAYCDHHPHSIIWQVTTGRRQRVDDMKCTSVLRALLIDCWSQTPQHRPPFSYIVRQLQENVSLHKRHSSSEPERLHHTGLPLGRGLCA